MPGYFMRMLANLYNSQHITVRGTDEETEAQKDSWVIGLSVAELKLEVKAGWCLGI